MSFLLDTNVFSEPARPRPDAGVLAWLASADENELFISAVTLAELRYGIERLPTGRKRTTLQEWLDRELRSRFGNRILAVESRVADTCGKLMAASERAGHPMKMADACIAATAVVHGLTLVTRNVSDFEVTVKSILSPWRESPVKEQ